MNFTRAFRVKPGAKVRLERVDPDETLGIGGKKHAAKPLADNLERMNRLQYLMYAENKRALLIVLQAMDAAGKDGLIRHVMTGLNPQGVTVTPFKQPSAEELDHDFLWRIHRAVPAKGDVGVFNRSHYEDVLIVRVHGLAPRSVWSKRYAQINAFERLLHQNDVTVLKFFLHISKDEQKKRFLERMRDPMKRWKASPADFRERERWDDYMQAYEAALSKCSTDHAPWFVIPANRPWFRNLAVSSIIVEAMERLKMRLPPPAFDVSKVKLD